jgi:hypothetical protein
LLRRLAEHRQRQLPVRKGAWLTGASHCGVLRVVTDCPSKYSG